jgi:hypothetical protein
MEDFIMCFAIARTAESFMLISYGGVYHSYDNPKSVSNGVFDMDGKKLKYPENTNKKLGDYLSMWEKAFDLTEDESDSEYFRMKLISLLKESDNRHVFARTFHYERILNLCKRLYTWKYATPLSKNFAKEFAIDTIGFEVPMRQKYSEFFGDAFDFDSEEEDIKPKKSKKKNKKEKKKKDRNEENEIKTEVKKEIKKERKKENKKAKQKAKSKDIEEIDGFIEGIDDL